MLKTNPRQAVQDMAKALKEVFKKYSLKSRRDAWEKISKGKGKKEIEVLILHPDKPTTRLNGLSFYEWVEKREI